MEPVTFTRGGKVCRVDVWFLDLTLLKEIVLFME
jgi:hypothetical protein